LIESGAASVWVATLARAQRADGFHSFYEDREEEAPHAGAVPEVELHAARTSTIGSAF
jgi:hypothetical protein